MIARPLAQVRIDVSLGLFETVLVVDGEPVELERHLRRLAWSTGELFGAPVPDEVAERARAHALGHARARMRIVAVPRPGGVDVTIAVSLVDRPGDERVTLEPVVLAGGLGPHKWNDRRAVEQLERDVAPAVPVFVDENGDVLEATRANVFVVRDGVLVTPPADGRLLRGVTRERVLERAGAVEDRVVVDELEAADEVFLTSAVRGVAVVRGGAVAAKVRELLP